LTPREQKAIIDDATSGGLEAAPIVFDDQVIQTPLLHGELFPLVNQIPIERGRRIEGVATGTVTSSWGGIDATNITLFTTTSYITAFDTTIYRWQGAIQIGLDFLSDTPIDFGAHVTAQYGERLLEDMDTVIATGNGTDRPEGVMQRTGVTAVNFGNTTSIGNYESLRFAVAKPEHRSDLMASAVFCGNETSYMRVKALPVGAADARRLFGTGNFGTSGYDNYGIMDRPFKINESLTNRQIFYCLLKRYRMYRRRGLTMRTSQEGDTLIRGNLMLITCTARYGGQLERGACAARTTTAPS
jgi:HK97 family phage major capsid protein